MGLRQAQCKHKAGRQTKRCPPPPARCQLAIDGPKEEEEEQLHHRAERNLISWKHTAIMAGLAIHDRALGANGGEGRGGNCHSRAPPSAFAIYQPQPTHNRPKTTAPGANSDPDGPACLAPTAGGSPLTRSVSWKRR